MENCRNIMHISDTADICTISNSVMHLLCMCYAFVLWLCRFCAVPFRNVLSRAVLCLCSVTVPILCCSQCYVFVQ